MTAILETKGLGKSFGRFAANADIDFSVARVNCGR